MWYSFGRVWGSEFLLFVGHFAASLEDMFVCSLWYSLVRVWESEFVLCVGSFLRGCGCECVMIVGQFGDGLGE